LNKLGDRGKFKGEAKPMMIAPIFELRAIYTEHASKIGFWRRQQPLSSSPRASLELLKNPSFKRRGSSITFGIIDLIPLNDRLIVVKDQLAISCAVWMEQAKSYLGNAWITAIFEIESDFVEKMILEDGANLL
jgi:hypothetical protein